MDVQGWRTEMDGRNLPSESSKSRVRGLAGLEGSRRNHRVWRSGNPCSRLLSVESVISEQLLWRVVTFTGFMECRHCSSLVVLTDFTAFIAFDHRRLAPFPTLKIGGSNGSVQRPSMDELYYCTNSSLRIVVSLTIFVDHSGQRSSVLSGEETMGNNSSSRTFPNILHIPDAELTEHYQLLQLCLSSLPEDNNSPNDRTLKSISDADSAEIIKSKIMSVSSQSLILDFEGSKLKVLSNICDTAHCSEEFFLTVDKKQLLRTAIKSDRAILDLLSLKPIGKVISNTIRHSNVLPCDPYWTDGASESVRFPCSILKEASRENKTLMTKVHEWKGKKEECDIGKHGQERPEHGNIQPKMPPTGLQKKFLDISLADVVTVRNCAAGGQGSIWVITWKHGKFIRKDYSIPENDYMIPEEFKTEVDVMERLCHPHIVYIFGISFDRMSSSLYMECMESDLLTVILDPNVRPGGDTAGPPFLHHDSVDILLQIAEALAHMHENNVIHGDLKSANILMSKFRICENQHRYLAKVADFGSAQVKSSKTFQPAAGTTQYAAPEVLKFREEKRSGKTEVISVPENIDVYCFGLVAFEVLTGKDMMYVFKYIHKIKCPSKGMKEGVMKGTLKPPLRTECQRDKFLYYESLISLIESCWVENSKRPSFSEIIRELINARDRLREASSTSANPPGLVDGPRAPKAASPINEPPEEASSIVDNSSVAPEEAVSRSNGHHLLLPDQAKDTSIALHGKKAASESSGYYPPTLFESITSHGLDSPIIRNSEVKDLSRSHSHQFKQTLQMVTTTRS